MKLIAALGNPGEKYKFTKHNTGFLIADYYIEKKGLSFKFENKFNAIVAKNQDVIILMPQTFMNLSGESVLKALNFYKLKTSDMLVVFDDFSLNLGRIRFRDSGSYGGHNGVKSIIELTKTDAFDRLKVGIGPKPEKIDCASFVLNNFNKEEIKPLESVVKGTCEAIDFYLDKGIIEAQNKYNGMTF